MIRIPTAVVALALCAAPLAAQSDAPAGEHTADASAPSLPPRLSPSPPSAPIVDARLRVDPAEAQNATDPAESDAWQRVVARPWWQYPAIGAAIGVTAGVIHAYAITQGDYVGLPVEPMYVLPVAYGAAGAFVGLLLDSAERERAARQ